ncbi:MFS transporter [Pullulanibacillus sp. KACC 23026]|uniref:MFS transporter n=1 Tax=Pullulanibacillus sp. KACC 23026 TaxID=3028315 RepID=UPI0023AF319D|nr:MFS transporter [Pullulanibacillus sp. KACC 23026]WEG14831.1 MFS transporter [Pullulanibacillus sp. KACC 23026]
MGATKRKMVIVSLLCGLGYMMYSVDRMVMSSTVGMVAKQFGLNKAQSGLVLSSFFYGFIALLFIGGLLSDKWTGKPVVIAGLVLFSFATGMTGLATGLTSMLIYRIITGLGEGAFWSAATLEVANVTSQQQRTKIMSLYWSGYPIGGFIGTFLGANLAPIWGWQASFFVACVLGLVIALLYGIMVKHDKQELASAAKLATERKNEEKVSVWQVLRYPSVWMLSIYYLVLLSGWWILLLWAPTFLGNVKQMGAAEGGTIASFLGISGAVGGYILGVLCDKGNLSRKKSILLWITFVSGILMALLALSLPTWLTIILIFALGFFGYPITPVILSITSQVVPKEMVGTATGPVMNIGMIAGGVSPVLAGAFSDKYGMTQVWWIAGIVMIISCVFLFFKVEEQVN